MLSQIFNQFLVLGLVPGTGLQITFTEILMAVEVLLLLFLFRSRLPLDRLRYYKAKFIVILSLGPNPRFTLPA